ncbi:hypothetical protein OPKNFCMD_3210 [Methylobacterium crusticola]|uniref:Uncharacterized protein n=1 Tax=Methylobacterium crusticola TaxID=1697972 RepID=A0ABQ4QYK3_9HYPH|nr:hypothetical protein [Methylobacterium crusticola]GJD50468.1 hypothetical protein OPKNFCMD_3210 [Methylobacterium crusticola]
MLMETATPAPSGSPRRDAGRPAGAGRSLPAGPASIDRTPVSTGSGAAPNPPTATPES